MITETAEAAPTPDPSGPLDRATLTEMTVEVVAAYLAHNTVQADDVPRLIAAVHGALGGLGHADEPEPVAAKPTPRVPIRRTVTDDHILSLEDGKPYKTLKRHLARVGLTPDAYRAKWGLPQDYPMVAPSYTRARSQLAKSLGLGTALRKR